MGLQLTNLGSESIHTLERVTSVTQQKARRGARFRNRDVLVRAVIICWMLITVLWKDNVLKIRFFLKGIISLILNCCVACVSRAAGGVHALLLRHEDQADLALLRSHAPSAGPALPRPARDHRHHQQIRHDLHRLGSSLLPGV